MFGPCGRLYVYFSYGVHWCANVVCGPEGTASAILLRAAQPIGAVPAMRQARWHGQRQLRDRDLCRGPGRLCEAFGITGADNGLDLTAPTGGLWLAAPGPAGRSSPRLGWACPGAPTRSGVTWWRGARGPRRGPPRRLGGDGRKGRYRTGLRVGYHDLCSPIGGLKRCRERACLPGLILVGRSFDKPR